MPPMMPHEPHAKYEPSGPTHLRYCKRLSCYIFQFLNKSVFMMYLTVLHEITIFMMYSKLLYLNSSLLSLFSGKITIIHSD